jgi:hypothetical protein
VHEGISGGRSFPESVAAFSGVEFGTKYLGAPSASKMKGTDSSRRARAPRVPDNIRQQGTLPACRILSIKGDFGQRPNLNLSLNLNPRFQ